MTGPGYGPRPRQLILAGLVLLPLAAAWFAWRVYTGSATQRARQVWAYLKDPAAHPEWQIPAGARCGAAPFVFPTTGVPGFIWGDSFRPGHHHSGVDIFGGQDPGAVPVIAAYSGFLTRQPDWKSAVIVRLPEDPLVPGRQIWVYYTHMADAAGNSFISAAFPPGAQEKPVAAGTLLGYQGNYSGNPRRPVGVHLHVSVVKDFGGLYANELEIENTYDPSPYFGLPLNAALNQTALPACP